MRRFLPAAFLAVLMVAIASRADAGYLIIRIILEGNSGAAGTTGGIGGELGGGIDPGDMGGAPGMSSPGPQPMGSPGGGRPGPGGIGPPGGSPGMPLGGTTTPAGPSQHDPTRSIVVVVPVDEDLTKKSQFYIDRAAHLYANPYWSPKLRLDIRGQKTLTNVFTDSSTVQLYETLKERPSYLRTHQMDVRDRFARWARSKTDPRAGYEILVAALEVGMVDEAVGYADQLLASVKDKKDGVPPEVAAFARSYAAVQKGLVERAGKRGSGSEWQARLEATTLTPGTHYTLLSWDATETEIQRRLAQLEDNFKGFFLAQSVRGVTLKVPETPLIAVMPKQGNDVFRMLGVFDGPSRLPADGFYVPNHDVLVLSPERLDSVGRTFTAQTQQMYQGGVSRSELLAGKGPKIDVNGKDGHKKPDEVARMQTVALVERLVEDAATMAAISREGSLQLLYSTELLPRHVALPEWLSNGAANYFARPKDPAYIQKPDGKWVMNVAPTTGYGVPNYVLQRHFRDIYGPLTEAKRDPAEAKELKDARLALLKNTITDAYFLGLRDPKDVNDPDPVKVDKSGVALTSGGGQPMGGVVGGVGGSPGGRPTPGATPLPGGPGAVGGDPDAQGGWGGILNPSGAAVPPIDDPVVAMRKKRTKLGVKAQASSWALYYYLLRQRPDQLNAFVAELAALPRDLPLDATTMTAVFCRAVGIDGSNESFGRFADEWLAYLTTYVPPAGIDIPLVDPKPPTTGTTDGGINPGGSVGPPPGGSGR